MDALAIRLRAVAGIEPLVWLTGVARLGSDEAYAALRANALAVLTDTLDSRPARSSRQRSTAEKGS